ncbi:MAG: hypothetical protein Q9225_007624 [Loekoesia sp. 1 TL-2023]
MAFTDACLRVLDLPTEIRIQILSYLLPDLPVIECDVDWSPNYNDPPRYVSPHDWEPEHECAAYDFRSDKEPCSTAILRANRQLHADGLRYLYVGKTYKLTVFDYGFDFLASSGQLRQLPPLPYTEIKEFVIQIAPCDLATTGWRLRSNLVWLCELLRNNNINFKKLRIEFVSDTRAGFWSDAWDETESDHPTPLSAEDNIHDLPNANLIAHDEGFGSTFAWMIRPLALLPKADECAIEVPSSLREKGHILALAKRYKEGIDGSYAFDDDWCLGVRGLKGPRRRWIPGSLSLWAINWSLQTHGKATLIFLSPKTREIMTRLGDFLLKLLSHLEHLLYYIRRIANFSMYSPGGSPQRIVVSLILLQMAPNDLPFKILDLPTELRIHIISFLLPDLLVIECDVGWSPCYLEDNPFSMPAAYKFRPNDGAYYPEILRTNRQLYADGMAYLYACKT